MGPIPSQYRTICGNPWALRAQYWRSHIQRCGIFLNWICHNPWDISTFSPTKDRRNKHPEDAPDDYFYTDNVGEEDNFLTYDIEDRIFETLSECRLDYDWSLEYDVKKRRLLTKNTTKFH